MNATSISTDMLQAFVQVADHLSVSVAATRLGVGKSSVSKRVAQLEGVVKATLFSRSTRRIALTPAGEAYLGHARRALDEMHSAEERLRDLRIQLSGEIRLTAPVSWGQRVLAPQLPDFLAQHPGIELDMQLGDRMVDIAYERIDLALRWTTMPVHELSTEPVARVEWLVTAAPAYLRSAGTPQQPEDLTGHSCLSYWRASSDDAWVLTHGTACREVRVRSRYHVNHPEAVADAALAGLGIALLPDYLCRDALTDGRLQRVLPPWTPQTRYGTLINAVATPERLRLARNQALLAFLRARLAV